MDLCARIHFAAPLLFAAVGATAAAQRAPLTPAQVLDRETLSDPQFSQAGDRIAVTVTDPVKGDARNSDIWIVDRKTKEARRFAASPKADLSPRWSPDGETLAFISDRLGKRDIFLIGTHGGEARALTQQKGGVSSFEWSPDGKRIAFTGRDAPTDDEEKREKLRNDRRVVDQENHPARLWLVDVASGAARRLTSGTWTFGEILWAPDGQRLYATATDTPDPDRETDRIVAVRGDSGGIQVIAQPRGSFDGLTVSPDGQWLTFLAAPVDGPSPHDLFLLPSTGGTPRNLTAGSIDRPIGSVFWRPAGTLVVSAADGFSTRLYDLALDGSAHSLDSMPVQPTAIALAPDGAVAFVGQSMIEAPELWLRDASGHAERLTSLNARWHDRPLVKGEVLHYKSFDGRVIEGALLLPAGGAAGGRLPLIVLVHGGPTGRWSDAFEPWGQMLVSRGYAVLYPNIRGSSGYGQKFIESNRADWGGGDFRDVMAGVDAIIARGIADSARLGIGGWSYGGYMSMWAVTQTTRFRASVAGAGLSDLASEFGTEGSAQYDQWFFGTPYEHQKEFIESSPITFIRRAKTPTLILQGENDTTDPIGQSQQFYRGLKTYAVPAELVLYPREGHGIREEQHLLDLYERMLGWYDRWVKGAPSATPSPEEER